MTQTTRSIRTSGLVLTVLLLGAGMVLQGQSDQYGRNDHNRQDQHQNQGQDQGRQEQGRQNQRQNEHAPAMRNEQAHRGPATPPRESQRTPQRPPRQLQRTPQQSRNQEAQQRQAWQNHRLPEGRMPENWGQRGGYHGGQIPTAYFGSHFGYQHRFRVYSLPFQMVDNVPRFQYNGYWFELAGPVPAYWGPDWYQNDDVFIVFAYGGYYLDNVRFPDRPGVAVSVIF